MERGEVWTKVVVVFAGDETYWLVSSCTISCWPQIESIGSTIPCLHLVWKLHCTNDTEKESTHIREKYTIQITVVGRRVAEGKENLEQESPSLREPELVNKINC